MQHGLNEWIYRLGSVVERFRDVADNAAQHAAGHSRSGTETLAEEMDDFADDGFASDEGFADDEFTHAEAAGFPGMPAAAAGLAALAAGRLLQPREVNWTRAIAAGLIGTLVYDVMMQVDQRVLGRKFDTITPLGAAITENEALQPAAAYAAHYTAGVGLALLYARYVYGRAPLPGVVQGMVFGAADAVALNWGGLVPVLARAVPHADLPPSFSALAHSSTLSAQSLARHLAYGAALGLVYRDEE